MAEYSNPLVKKAFDDQAQEQTAAEQPATGVVAKEPTAPKMSPSPSSPSNTFPGNRLPGNSGSTSAVADAPAPAPAPAPDSPTQGKGLDAPWWSHEYATAARLSDKSGAELDQMRQSKAVPNDWAKSIFLSGTTGPAEPPKVAAGGQPSGNTFDSSTAVDPTYGLAPIKKPEQNNLSAPQPDTPSGQKIAQDVYKHGRGQYSDRADGMGFADKFTGQPNAQNMAAADALAARGVKEALAQPSKPLGPGSGPVEPGSFTGGFSGSIGQSSGYGNAWSRTPEQQRRDAETQASSIHKNTAERGKAALAALNGQDVERVRGENSAHVERINNETLNQRTLLEQQALDRRSNVASALDRAKISQEQQRLAMLGQKQGFETRLAERQERVRGLYDAAKDDAQRAALMQQYPDVLREPAEDLRKYFLETGGGEEWDANAGMMRKLPKGIVDLRQIQAMQRDKEKNP